MVWWQYLLSSSVTTILGILLGFYLSRHAASKERESIEREKTTGAARSILAEIEANLELASQPWKGRLTPFLTDMWTAYKGEILSLPKDLQDAIRKTFIEIQQADAIVQTDLHKVAYGGGYLNDEYREKRDQIKDAASKARAPLIDWLRKTGD